MVLIHLELVQCPFRIPAMMPPLEGSGVCQKDYWGNGRKGNFCRVKAFFPAGIVSTKLQYWT